jgi:dihydroorotase
VTGEVCPHHLALTDRSLSTFDSNYKMMPPLRTPDDIQALLAGLRDGTLQVIASDHSPHSPEKKMRELEYTPNGVVGLETLLPVCITELIVPGHLTWLQLIEKLTINPARVLGLNRGTLKPGVIADVTLIDPDVEWSIDPATFHGKSRNTPFGGKKVRGRAVMALVGGVVKYDPLGRGTLTLNAGSGAKQFPGQPVG